MKVSQMGLKPGEKAEIEKVEKPDAQDGEEAEDVDGELVDDNVRFTKLNQIDVEYKDYKVQVYNNSFTLEELVEIFRNFAASQLRLYYTSEMIRLFISALSVYQGKPLHQRC